MNTQDRLPVFFLITVICFLTGSLILTFDRLTWILEVFPILVAVPILIATYRRMPLTNFIYFFIIVHSLILTVGGIYTYAKVPLGFWMQDWFGFARNHYDRIGHFAQGFIPALITREILIRLSPLKKGKWLSFIIVSICLAISAFYELIEFGYAKFSGGSADAFLGSQGDEWDAQWDMTFALIGAILALILLSRLHDRFLIKMGVEIHRKETE